MSLPFADRLNNVETSAIRELFKLSPERELPLPVDYVVAAAGG